MDKILQIEILDAIGGWGFSLKDLVSQMKGFRGDKISVPINTYGGEVTEGLAIYNVLKGSRAFVETNVVGYAMSMGTVIALAGDRVTMPENGYFMIHEPWGMTVGDSEEAESMSELLESMANQIAGIYSKKTGMTVNKLRKLMKAETWLTAKEAKKMGFIDEVTEGARIEANAEQFSKFYNIPKAVKDTVIGTPIEEITKSEIPSLGTNIEHNNSKKMDNKFFDQVKSFFGFANDSTEDQVLDHLKSMKESTDNNEFVSVETYNELASKFDELNSSMNAMKETFASSETIERLENKIDTSIKDVQKSYATLATIDELKGEVQAVAASVAESLSGIKLDADGKVIGNVKGNDEFDKQFDNRVAKKLIVNRDK